jgi:3-phenylpropionate/trans-cinnamate dioxygenase ferredoxin subunit
MTFVRVARVSDIPASGVLGVAAPDGRRVCLIRRGDAVTATRDECPHSAFPLSEGEVLSDGSLQCGWHGARFDCATGALLDGPATDPLEMLAVRRDGDDVLLEDAR